MHLYRATLCNIFGINIRPQCWPNSGQVPSASHAIRLLVEPSSKRLPGSHDTTTDRDEESLSDTVNLVTKGDGLQRAKIIQSTYYQVQSERYINFRQSKPFTDSVQHGMLYLCYSTIENSNCMSGIIVTAVIVVNVHCCCPCTNSVTKSTTV